MSRVVPLAQHALLVAVRSDQPAARAVLGERRALQSVFLVTEVHKIYPPCLLTKPSIYFNLRPAVNLFNPSHGEPYVT